uniref:Hsp20/alpha crystallin family protein n=1 Tax=candidate division WWE3 bacterium TaxID=2053526 RepID=A0A7C4TM09_UNCKA
MKIIKRKNSGLTPYIPMRSMLDDFFSPSTLFDEMFSSSFVAKNLSVDVWEEDENFFVKMAMPGVDKDSIEITTSAESVTIKGGTRKEEEKKEDKRNYYYRALDTSFEQTFNLPTRVDSDKAEASYKDGVLTLKLPKSDEVKPKKIEIK